MSSYGFWMWKCQKCNLNTEYHRYISISWILIWSMWWSLPIKCTSSIFYICDDMSGHFCDLPITHKWTKFICFMLQLELIWIELLHIWHLLIAQVKFFLPPPPPPPRHNLRMGSILRQLLSIKIQITSLQLTQVVWNRQVNCSKMGTLAPRMTLQNDTYKFNILHINLCICKSSQSYHNK